MDPSAPETRSETPRSRRQRFVLPVLYITLFILVFGEAIQPAPRTQVYQSIICQTHGDDSALSWLVGANDDRCKSKPVQRELAFLQGTEQLLSAWPSKSCSDG